MNWEPEREAKKLYYDFIERWCCPLPKTYAELLNYVELSGATVCQCFLETDDFEGIQIGTWIYVNKRETTTDHGLMLILAHEWAHWLRRHWRNQMIYDRDREEAVALAFERLF